MKKKKQKTVVVALSQEYDVSLQPFFNTDAMANQPTSIEEDQDLIHDNDESVGELEYNSKQNEEDVYGDRY